MNISITMMMMMCEVSSKHNKKLAARGNNLDIFQLYNPFQKGHKQFVYF